MGMDGYHPAFTHKSPTELMRRMRGGSESGDSRRFRELELFSREKETGKIDPAAGLTRDLGNGQVMLDMLVARKARGAETLAQLGRTSWGRAYLEAMEKRHGRERAHELIILGGDPHIGIFPNFQFIAVHIRVFRPLSAAATEVYMYPTLLSGAPDELNEQRLRLHEWFFSPCGFGTPDDYEMFERNQLGLQGELGPGVLLSRGLRREYRDSDGTIAGDITDEVTQRGQLREWAQWMSEPA